MKVRLGRLVKVLSTSPETIDYSHFFNEQSEIQSKFP